MTQQRQRLMLVESDQDTAANFNGIFSKKFDVINAKTSIEALNKVKDTEIDLIVTNCIISGLSKKPQIPQSQLTAQEAAKKEISLIRGLIGDLLKRLDNLLKGAGQFPDTQETSELIKRLRVINDKMTIMTNKDVRRLQGQKLSVEQELEVLKTETNNLDGETNSLRLLINEAKTKLEEIESEKDGLDRDLKTALKEKEDAVINRNKAVVEMEEAKKKASYILSEKSSLETKTQGSIRAKAGAQEKAETAVKEKQEAMTQAETAIKETQEAITLTETAVKEKQEAMTQAETAIKEKAEIERVSSDALNLIADLEAKLDEARAKAAQMLALIDQNNQLKAEATLMKAEADNLRIQAEKDFNETLIKKKEADIAFENANRLKKEAEDKILEQTDLADKYNNMSKNIDVEEAKIKNELKDALSVAEEAMKEKVMVEEKFLKLQENWESFIAGM